MIPQGKVDVSEVQRSGNDAEDGPARIDSDHEEPDDGLLDAVEFGGSGVGNGGKIVANGDGSHGQPFSANITVPPLGSVWFRPAK